MRYGARRAGCEARGARREGREARARRAARGVDAYFMGWSDNKLNNLHVKMSPETKSLTTCAARS